VAKVENMSKRAHMQKCMHKRNAHAAHARWKEVRLSAAVLFFFPNHHLSFPSNLAKIYYWFQCVLCLVNPFTFPYQIPKPLMRQFVSHHRGYPLPLLRRRFRFVNQQIHLPVGDLRLIKMRKKRQAQVVSNGGGGE